MHMDNVAAPVWEETSDQISPRTGDTTETKAYTLAAATVAEDEQHHT
jgi:hypothetical protein